MQQRTFSQKPLTHRERAEQVKNDYLGKYAGTARKVLELLLDKYTDAGISEIESLGVLKLQPFDRFGSVPQIINEFGGKPQYLSAFAGAGASPLPIARHKNRQK